jgi:hypothetical protein
MSVLNNRRILGPINQFPVSGSVVSGGGGGGITINGNTDGNILKATGDGSTITGLDTFTINSSNVVSGSGQIKAQSFAFEGTNASGISVLYKLEIRGGMLSLVSSSL